MKTSCCYFINGTARVGPLGGWEAFDVLVLQEAQGGQSEPQRRRLEAIGRAPLVLLQLGQRQNGFGDAGFGDVGPLLRQYPLYRAAYRQIRWWDHCNIKRGDVYIYVCVCVLLRFIKCFISDILLRVLFGVGLPIFETLLRFFQDYCKITNWNFEESHMYFKTCFVHFNYPWKILQICMDFAEDSIQILSEIWFGCFKLNGAPPGFSETFPRLFQDSL